MAPPKAYGRQQLLVPGRFDPRLPSERGGRGPQKLDWERVRKMRRLWAVGIPNKQLAEKFHISIGMVSMIISGQRWKEKR